MKQAVALKLPSKKLSVRRSAGGCFSGPRIQSIEGASFLLDLTVTCRATNLEDAEFMQ